MKKTLKIILCIFLCFCVAFTTVIGGWAIANPNGAFKLGYAIQLIRSNFLFDYDNDQLVEGAIAGMIDALGDPYSEYMDMQATQNIYESTLGVFGGIGVMVTENKDGRTVITATIEGGPGEKAGIMGEDIVYAVNDVIVLGMSVDEVVSLMRGEIGTQVKITIERQGELIDFDLIREKIAEQTVSSMVLTEDERVGYIAISQFSDNTDEAFVEQLNEMIEQGIESLIIDLRYNGGGSVDAACNIAALMTPEGPIVEIVYNDGQSNVIDSPGAQIKAPIVVLVNGYTASASEIVAGALQDTKAAVLVGTNTYGKGIVQNIYFLHDGTGIKLTEAKYLTPNGNDIHQKGIAPDIVVENNGLEDEQFAVALEYIKAQLGK